MREIHNPLAAITGGGDLAQVLRGASVVLATRILASALTYLLLLSLARWMGATELGIYSYAFGWVALLTLPAGLGLHAVVVRYAPDYLGHGDWPRLRGLLSRSLLLTLAASLAVAGAAIGVALLCREHLAPAQVPPLLLALCGVPVMALLTLQSQIGRAFGWVVVGYGPSQVLQPALLIGAAALLWLGDGVTAVTLVPIALLLSLGVVVGQLAVYARRLGGRLRGVLPHHETRRWLRVALPLLLFDGFTGLMTQSDLLIVGTVLTPADVAYYNAALRTAALVTFCFDAVGALAGPRIAALWARRAFGALQALLRGVIPWSLLPALAVGAGLALFGHPLLRLFGEGFDVAYAPMLIIAAGYLVTMAIGPVALLLNMTAHQDESARLLGLSAAVNVALNVLLIPRIGLAGAALATSTARVLATAWMHRTVRRRLGLRPSVLSRLDRPD